MDENLVLLFVGVLMGSSAALQILRARPPGWPGLLATPALVLCLAGGAYLWLPAWSGYVAGGAAALFILAPMRLGQAMQRAMFALNYPRARRLALLTAILQPVPARLRFVKLLKLWEGIDGGRITPEDLQAGAQRAGADQAGGDQQAYGRALASHQRYAELAEYCRAADRDGSSRDPSILGLAARAQGELGNHQAMLELVERLSALPGAAAWTLQLHIVVAGLAGEPQLVERLARGPLAILGKANLDFWHGTALMVAGDPAGRQLLAPLAQAGGGTGLSRAASHRLAHPPTRLSQADRPAALRNYLAGLERELTSSSGLTEAAPRAVATPVIMLAIGIGYLIQIPGGTTDIPNLIKLGALVAPRGMGYDEPFRWFTACFLHLGFTHLAMNLLGLHVLGRPVESVLGTRRLLLLFVGAGVLANLGSLMLIETPTVLVGASGGIMGLLGAMTAILLQRRRRGSTPYLRRALRGMAIVVGVQIVFDATMPNVGSLTHALGFASGFVLGGLMAPRPASEAPAAA